MHVFHSGPCCPRVSAMRSNATKQPSCLCSIMFHVVLGCLTCVAVPEHNCRAFVSRCLGVLDMHCCASTSPLCKCSIVFHAALPSLPLRLHSTTQKSCQLQSTTIRHVFHNGPCCPRVSAMRFHATKQPFCLCSIVFRVVLGCLTCASVP